MIGLKRWVRNFFGFSRSQTNAFLILIPLMIAFIFSEPLWRWWVASRPRDSSADRQKLDSLIAIWDIRDSVSLNSSENKVKASFFSFDPNKASIDDLQALGFSKGVANRILHYREKGGVFKVKSDVLKMYGVDSTHYHQLYAFIVLPEKRESIPLYESKPQTFARKPIERFDLNLADTAQLKKIYGIGEKLSLRILKYREALGGFIEMNQLSEVYGLDSTVVNRLMKKAFINGEFSPVKIDINAIAQQELAVHPYLSNKDAKAIVAYRFQHGKFGALSDLENILGVEAETIRKIAPYLKFND